VVESENEFVEDEDEDRESPVSRLSNMPRQQRPYETTTGIQFPRMNQMEISIMLAIVVGVVTLT
jgi:hypothetical protein